MNDDYWAWHTMTYLYLRSLGWKVDPVWPDRAVRGELQRRRSSAVVGLPKTPLPHGKISDQAWNYFSDALRTDHNTWRERIRSKSKWYVLPEDPKEGVFFGEAPDHVNWEIPRADLYFFSDERPTMVLATDHEEEGPWILDSSCPVKAIVRRTRRPLIATHLVAEPIPQEEFRAALAWLRQRLRAKGLYIPPHRLAGRGIAHDNLWNYVPELFDCSLEPRSLCRQAFRQSEGVLAWSEANGEYGLLKAPEDGVVLEHGDAYYLEWPDRRWLIAVPGVFLQEGEESMVSPSFVPL